MGKARGPLSHAHVGRHPPSNVGAGRPMAVTFCCRDEASVEMEIS